MPTPSQRLRTTFEEVAERYDRARPTYPPAVFDDLAALAGLREGARVVEVGCGTRQATLPLAQRGCEVTCVELGARLAALARRKLAAFANVEVVNVAFEAWRPARAEFDAVVAFTSFHWIDPDVRYATSASLLRDDGALAVVATRHVLPEDGDGFFADVQEDYAALVPGAAGEGPPPPPDAVPDLGAEIAGSGLFRNVACRRHVWDVEYDADEYLAVLGTYSGHIALDAAVRERLFDRIRRRIEARPERRVRKTYLAILNVARRL